jgi:formylglycine-generating enzyme required for sulfatase activity
VLAEARGLVEAGDQESAIALLVARRREFSLPAPLDELRARVALELGQRRLEGSPADPGLALDAYRQALVAAGELGGESGTALREQAQAGVRLALDELDRVALAAGGEATRARAQGYLEDPEDLRGIHLLQRLAAAGDRAARAEAETHLRRYLTRNLVVVGAGRVTIRSAAGPVNVHVERFQIGRFEVTCGEYAQYLRATGLPVPAAWRDAGPPNPDLPVTGVTRAEAGAYARWLGLRLPTEAEWLKAAQGIDHRQYPWGNDPEATGHALVASPLPTPGPELAAWQTPAGPTGVGSYLAGISPYGCHDMAGNVAEWTSSTFGGTPLEDGELAVVKGGAWAFGPVAARIAHRWGVPTGQRDPAIGFRLAGSVE